MDIVKIKLVVELTKAKVDILKLKADSYQWSCFVDEDTKTVINETLMDIDEHLICLRNKE